MMDQTYVTGFGKTCIVHAFNFAYSKDQQFAELIDG